MDDSETQSQESVNDSKVFGKMLKIPYVRARLNNYDKSTSIKHLGSSYYGKLVAINATVVRVCNSKDICLSLDFQCRRCNGLTIVQQTDGNYKPPSRCTAEVDNIPCTGTQLEPVRGSLKIKMCQWQAIRLQENSSDGRVI